MREEAESGGLQGLPWDGRLLGGVEASPAAAALLRIPESSVGGLRGQRGEGGLVRITELQVIQIKQKKNIFQETDECLKASDEEEDNNNGANANK